jgi:hypothetical protein
MTDAELVALHRAGTVDCPAGGRGCPSADELVALAEDRLEGTRRAEVLDRVARCAGCAGGLQVAMESAALGREIAAALADDGSARVVALPARRAPRLAAFAMAASAVLAVGVVALVARAPAPDPTRGAAVAALEPVDRAVLGAAPERLRWDCAQAQPARVQLLDAAGASRWSAGATGCDVALPAEVRGTLGAGLWLWQVQDPGGRSVIAGPYSFRIE